MHLTETVGSGHNTTVPAAHKAAEQVWTVGAGVCSVKLLLEEGGWKIHTEDHRVQMNKPRQTIWEGTDTGDSWWSGQPY